MIAGAFSSHPLLFAAKSSPSTTIDEPTNQTANSVQIKQKYIDLDRFEKMK